MRADRRVIAAAAVFMDMAFGTIQAWSVFRNPLMEAWGWTISEVTFAYTLHYAMFGVAAFLGGLWIGRAGPRRAGLTAGVLYGLGVALAGFSGGRLWFLYAAFGLTAGLGRGLGGIVAVTTIVRWFPDRRGTASGLSGLGFGTGTLIAAPLAAHLIMALGAPATFQILGAACLVVVLGTASVMSNPPAGFAPVGWAPGPAMPDRRAGRSFTLRESLKTWQLYALFGLMFFNAVAGLGLVSQAAPMAREVTGADALSAAGMVGLMAFAYAAGRFSWAWLSDHLGRKRSFAALFMIQALAFGALPLTSRFPMFSALAVVAFLCHGGVVGVLPAFLADCFGPDHVGSLFGLTITAQAAGGVLGPMLQAVLYESSGAYTPALFFVAALMFAAALVSTRLRPVRQ
ncbi:MAG: OFA family MFS transporter [Pseudomonadota bacterium]